MILVTGGTGLLGSYLITFLLENSIKNIRVLIRNENQEKEFKNSERLIFSIGNINDISSLEDSFHDVTEVYHCAGLVSFSPFDKENLLKINVEGTANIVNQCLDRKIKLCHVSSVAAIGKSKSGSISNEETHWDDSSYNSFYGYTKYLGELEVWRGIEEGLEAVIVNPSVILGPANWNRSSMKLFKYVKDEHTYYSGGGNNFVDVRDVSSIMYNLMDKSIFHERFIIAGDRVEFKLLFEKIANCINVKAPQKQVKNWMLSLLWRIEYLKSYLFKTTPLLTKETAKVSERKHQYASDKIKDKLSFKFKSIDDTISWVSKNI